MSHAEKGAEWLDRHLEHAGRTRAQLASELWSRNETAVFELCDDAFEEHVLPYDKEHAGLYLHGLNKNSVQFDTRIPPEVDAFARQWGFRPTHFLTLDSFQGMQDVVARVAQDGTWEGQPIEGFVVRTTIPLSTPSIKDALSSHRSRDEPVRPPYERGQTWFYKVKFDEPYLMYRDWRELARRMLADQDKWIKEYGDSALKLLQAGGWNALHSHPVGLEKSSDAHDTTERNQSKAEGAVTNTESGALSKKAAKRQARARWQATQQRSQWSETGGRPLPDKPKPKTRRAETSLFLEWCYEQLWGSAKGNLPRPALFTQFSQGKGIIRLRDEFLSFCASSEGQARLQPLLRPAGPSGSVPSGSMPSAGEGPASDEPAGPFTHTLIIPISVPGSGKTTLARALGRLYPDLGHPQSDMLTGKKSKATQFLAQVLSELKQHKIVFADRNNHLFKHRSELVDLVRKIEKQGWELDLEQTQPGKKSRGKKGGQLVNSDADAMSVGDKTAAPKPRIRLIALQWTFGSLRHGELKNLLCERIVARGQNHPTLKADLTSPVGQVEHEKIISIFLNQMQAFEHKTKPLVPGVGGNQVGTTGYQLAESTPDCADGLFHDAVSLDINASLEENLSVLLDLVHSLDPTFTTPSKTDQNTSLAQAHAAAEADRLAGKPKNDGGGSKAAEEKPKKPKPMRPRYFGINIPHLDLVSFVGQVLSTSSASPDEQAQGKEFLSRLAKNGQLVKAPHVTVVHQNSLKNEQSMVKQAQSNGSSAETPMLLMWNKFTSKLESLSSACAPPSAEQASETHAASACIPGFSVAVTGVIWSGRVMSLIIATIANPSFPDWNEHLSSDFVPHITVGTADESIRPIEGRTLVDAYQQQNLAPDSKVATLIEPLTLSGQLEGMVV